MLRSLAVDSLVMEAFSVGLSIGCGVVREPVDEPYGDRCGGVRDPFGNTWWIATHIRDVAF